jgi:hypothetical protein
MSKWHACCAGESVITVYERAMAQVWLRLEAIAAQFGVSEALQVFVRVRAATASLHALFRVSWTCTRLTSTCMDALADGQGGLAPHELY